MKVTRSVFMIGFVLIFSIFLLYLTMGAHIITISGGNTSITVEQGVTTIYNITINNTDGELNNNLTEVNITIMNETIVFIGGSQGTDALGDFTNTSRSLNWTNSSGLVMNLTTKNFWFSANTTRLGTYNLSIQTTNSSGSYISYINITVNDTVSPSISYNTNTYSNNSKNSSTFIIINISASDLNFANVTVYLFNSTNGLINSSNNSVSPLYVSFVGLTAGSGTTYYFNATTYDSLNNKNFTSTRTITLDSNAPSVSDGPHEDSIDSDSAVITWDTNENTNSRVDYATDNNWDDNDTKTSSTLETDHSVSLSSLEPDTTYYYKVRSCDEAGNCVTSGSDNFDTAASDDDSGGSGGGSDVTTAFWHSPFIYDDKEFSLKGNITKNLIQGDRFKIKINNEVHYVGVTRVRSSSITVNVSSTPQSATIDKGKSKKFNIDTDNYYDILVSVNDIINTTKVNLTISYVHDMVTLASANSSSPNSTKNTTIVYDQTNASDLEGDDAQSTGMSTRSWIVLVVVVLLVIALAAGGYLFVTKKSSLFSPKNKINIKSP